MPLPVLIIFTRLNNSGMRNLLAILVLQSFIFPVSAQENNPVYMPPEEFRNSYNLEVYAILVDVRIKKEFRKERISGARNVENMKAMTAFADTLDTETPIYIYCDTYTRSITAAEYLCNRGFTNVYLLKDGLMEWKAAGLPVDKGRKTQRRKKGL